MVSDDATRITLSFAVAAEVRALFSVSLPSIADIQHRPVDYDTDTLRQGEITGTAFALGAGAFVSMIAKDSLPLIVSGVMCLGMIATYEHAIRHPGRPTEPVQRPSDS